MLISFYLRCSTKVQYYLLPVIATLSRHFWFSLLHPFSFPNLSTSSPAALSCKSACSCFSLHTGDTKSMKFTLLVRISKIQLDYEHFRVNTNCSSWPSFPSLSSSFSSSRFFTTLVQSKIFQASSDGPSLIVLILSYSNVLSADSQPNNVLTGFVLDVRSVLFVVP